eukprot:PhM_4_TR2834/c0_g1_i1/m.10834/K10396/KIF5; kinesin family member 5
MTDTGKSENIHVTCRVRPALGDAEQTSGRCVTVSPDSTSVMVGSDDSTQQRVFEFERVFSPYSTQEDVYATVVPPLLTSVMNGYSSAILVYGQTSSGKTHTMLGSGTEPGLIPRAVDDLFNQIAAADPNDVYHVRCGALQVYMETVYDMTATVTGRLPLAEIVESDGTHVTGACFLPVENAAEVNAVIAQAESTRVTASTLMNMTSSRSHAIFILSVTRHEIATGNEKMAFMYLVDLAGSEGIEKTMASGLRQDEAKYINTSLLTLRRVIDSLNAQESHIPYRDSKLTRLLKSCLGGNSRAALIVCVSPSAYNELETLSSLRFGSSTRQIQNNPTQSLYTNADELENLITQAQLKVLQAKTKLFQLQKEYQRVLKYEGADDDNNDGDDNSDAKTDTFAKTSHVTELTLTL